MAHLIGSEGLAMRGQSAVERNQAVQLEDRRAEGCPLRAFELEQLAQGRTWNAETCAFACAKLQTLAKPMSDHRGSAEYRAALVIKLFQKFYAESSEAET